MLSVAAILCLLIVAFLYAARSQSPSPVVSAGTVAASRSTTSASASATPISSAPVTPFTDSTYRYGISVPSPYRLSGPLTVTFNGANPAAQDVFTAQTPEQEAAGSAHCETACPIWDYTLEVVISANAGSMTPRQWYDAGHVGFSTQSTFEDITMSGRPALKIMGSARFPMEYLVADGRGQMFDLAYTIRPERPAPVGASLDKLEQMIASFRLLP